MAKNSHRKKLSSPHLPTPSTAVISILASIVACAAADAHPVAYPSAPPDFLCPRAHYHQDFSSSNVPGPSTVPTPTVTPHPHGRRPKDRAVPDSYTRGEDGRWRKISQWEFYGSTVCLCDAGANDPLVSDDISSVGATPSGTSDDELDSLPTGWASQATATSSRNGLILSLSLVLAILMSAFIVGCIYWRRSRKARAERDPEKRLSKRKATDEGSNAGEAKIKSKLWAKASARWKDNVKHSARRRRNARITSASMSQLNASNVSLPSHTPVSRRSTAESSRSTTPTPSSNAMHPLSDEHSDTESTPSEPTQSSPENPPRSPPAYQGNHPREAKVPVSSGNEATCSFSHQVQSSDPPPPASPVDESQQPQYSPPLHIAHVATDDKTILHRMVGMSSAPPEASGSTPLESSAPALFEDDTEGFSHYTHSDSQDADVPSVMFPAPPQPAPSSKGKMVEMYDYDDVHVEPPSGPSAPPFEASPGPSAPPFDEEDAGPSAPPLEDEELHPSAPPLDDVASSEGGSAPPAGDGDRDDVLHEAPPPRPRNAEWLPRYQP